MLRPIFITLCFVLLNFVWAQSQCNIKELSITPMECNVNGQFFVRINFVHTGTSESFKIQGNGTNYGSFKYSGLPVTVGPLTADCIKEYEFVVRDEVNTACVAFKSLGKKCCDDLCIVSFGKYDIGACADGFYDFTFNAVYNALDKGMDVYNNGSFVGYYEIKDAPITIPALKSNPLETFQEIMICSKSNNQCCDTLRIVNPCVCSITNVRAKVKECDIENKKFDLQLDFDHNKTKDSFLVGGNAMNYGKFAYKDLPVTIKNLSFSTTTDYEFLIIDQSDAFCFASYALGIVNDCNFECEISDVQATVSNCIEGKFFVDLRFKEKNTGLKGFRIRGNGKIYGSFEYGHEPYSIGLLEVDCNKELEFVVQDIEEEACSDFTVVQPPKCCTQACTLADVEVKEICEEGVLKSLVLDFEHSGNGEKFVLTINNKVIGTFLYSNLPLKISEFNFDFPNLVVKIRDGENESCFVVKEYKTTCSPEKNCILSNLRIETDCEGGEVKFLYIIVNHAGGGEKFNLTINNKVIGTFSYSELPLKISEFNFDFPNLEIKIRDTENEDCFIVKEFKTECGSNQDCALSDMLLQATTCNEAGQFYTKLKFKAQKPGAQGFGIKVNGVLWDTLPYGQAVYEIGPLEADCETIYSFLIYDIENPACAEDAKLDKKVCCGEDCDTLDTEILFVNCEEGRYDVSFNFEASSAFENFKLKVNDKVLGPFKKQNLPIIVTEGLLKNEENKIVVWDLDNEACRFFYTMPPAECTSATQDKSIHWKVYQQEQQLIFELDTDFLPAKIEVFDVFGRNMGINTITELKSFIEVSHWMSGVYVLKLQRENRFWTKAMVKF